MDQLAEEIKVIQNRLRIALKNYHILYSRLKLHPNDNLAMEHMSVLENVIRSLGKQQNEMLVLFKQKLAKQLDIEEPDMVTSSMLDKYLHWDIPEKEIKEQSPTRPTTPKNGDITPSKMPKKSLLSHKSTKKEKVETENDLSIDSSKVFNIYKDLKKPSILAPELKLKHKSKETQSIDLTEKISPMSSETPSDDDYGSYVPVNKMKMTRYRMKTIAAKKSIFSVPHNFSQLIEGNELATDKSEISQEKFLCFFGLVDKERSKLIRNKRGERKRRSVAGQSNFYSDYLQPQKRSYIRKSPTQTSPTNQVIVETATIRESDEEAADIEASKLCFVCKTDENTKKCSCGDIYHTECLKNKTCSCNNEKSVESIVGGTLDLDNLVLSTPSSSEWVKRYQNNCSSLKTDC